MTLKIEINMDNDAFTARAGDEAARILRQIADRMEEPYAFDGFSIRDVNGNRVGKVNVE